jgi:hypothetical protein
MPDAVKSPVAPIRTVFAAARGPAISRIWSLMESSRRA